jgi:hypothetical protein
MREYVFLLEYDHGVHPVRDAFIDNPEVVATALDISTSLNGGVARRTPDRPRVRA